MYKIIYKWLICELIKAQDEFNNQKAQTYQSLTQNARLTNHRIKLD
jgi:hypothetical protein